VDVADVVDIPVAPGWLGEEQRERVDEREPCRDGDQQSGGQSEVEVRPSRALHVFVLSSVAVVETAWLGAVAYLAVHLM
jgi:hypothetical protein